MYSECLQMSPIKSECLQRSPIFSKCPQMSWIVQRGKISSNVLKCSIELTKSKPENRNPAGCQSSNRHLSRASSPLLDANSSFLCLPPFEIRNFEHFLFLCYTLSVADWVFEWRRRGTMAAKAKITTFKRPGEMFSFGTLENTRCSAKHWTQIIACALFSCRLRR